MVLNSRGEAETHDIYLDDFQPRAVQNMSDCKTCFWKEDTYDVFWDFSSSFRPLLRRTGLRDTCIRRFGIFRKREGEHKAISSAPSKFF